MLLDMTACALAMHLTQVLMRRAGWIALGCLALTLFLAGWRAQSDVFRESRGALESARLMHQLSRLQSAAPAQLDATLRDLRLILASGELRHVEVMVADASGQVLAASPMRDVGADNGSTWLIDLLQPKSEPASEVWSVENPIGRRFNITLTTNSASERGEAQANIMAMALVLLFYSVTLLIGLYWAVRHAFAPIRNILLTLTAWERQDFRRRMPDLNLWELNTIGRAANHLAQALEDARDEQRRLALKVLNLQEDELQRLARELHDDFAQTITALRADASYLKRRLLDPDLQEVAHNLGERCGQMQQGMRHLLRRLRPAQAGHELALADMIHGLVRHWQALPGQTQRFDCRLNLGQAALSQGLALTLFRLTQEALTNAARHAGPCTVRIHLAADHAIHWSVEDDGNGVANLDLALEQGNGLIGMRERVWAHGGALHMRSDPGHGLQLSAHFPLAAQGANA